VYKPVEYLYGENDRVFTHLELGERIAAKAETVIQAENLVMIQCVGCRNTDRNYCSRVCCSHAVKNALKLKEIIPGRDIHILFRDMRTYGFREDAYREASEKHVKFIRYDPDDNPQVKAVKEGGKSFLRITVPDAILGQRLELDAYILLLVDMVIHYVSNQKITRLFKVTLSPDDFFKEAHVKLKPVEFATDGVFLCGIAHYPKHIPEVINQAYGAADLAGVSRLQYANEIRLIRAMCSGRVDLEFILRAFSNGQDGVFIGGCQLDECNYITHGNYDALSVTYLCKRIMEHIGLNPERLRIQFMLGADGNLLAEVADDFTRKVKTLGPLGKGEGLDKKGMKLKLDEVVKTQNCDDFIKNSKMNII
jgi:heterodisulfide reductase subunit A-like polyferredoxin